MRDSRPRARGFLAVFGGFPAEFVHTNWAKSHTNWADHGYKLGVHTHLVVSCVHAQFVCTLAYLIICLYVC